MSMSTEKVTVICICIFLSVGILCTTISEVGKEYAKALTQCQKELRK